MNQDRKQESLRRNGRRTQAIIVTVVYYIGAVLVALGMACLTEWPVAAIIVGAALLYDAVKL